MFPSTLKRWALRFLPDRALQQLKKIHYANALRSASEEDEPDLAIVRHLVQPGSYVVDIGANFGLYTKFLAERVGPSGRVYSLEPVPLTYEILTSNLKRLKLGNVEPFNVAVSDRDAEVRMEVPHYRSGGENFYEARIVAQKAAGSDRSVAVKARSLDSLFGSLRSIEFVKCDVEGHELACLRGATTLLQSITPAWLIEISGNPDDESSSAHEVFELMEQNGYRPFWYDGLHLREREPGDRSVNYFFLNEKHLSLIPQKLMKQKKIALGCHN